MGRQKTVLRLCGWLSFAAYALAEPAVKVSLRTSWPEVPLLLEAIESIASEDVNAFFPILDALVSSESAPPLAKLSPEAIHEFTFRTAVSLGYLEQPGALESAQLQVALHAAAPKIQAYYQFFEDQYPTYESESECGSWVDWYGERICDLDTLARLVSHESIDAGENDVPATSTFTRPKLLSFDHIYPSPAHTIDTPPRTAILYASPYSANFRDLHTYLYKIANSPIPRLEYVLRPIPARTENRKSNLSGYGVALDLKKTDYLAVDDRRSSSRTTSREKESPEAMQLVEEDVILSAINAYPENTTADMTIALTEKELLDIDLQATQLIINSTNPLEILTQLSQNFPKYTTTMARRVALNSSVVEEVEENQLKAQGGINMMWLNGQVVQESDLDPLSLLRLLRKERGIVGSLTSLGLSPSQAVDLLTHRAIAVTQRDTAGVLDGIFDASDRPEGGEVIRWWNDITKDSRYERWNPSITGLLAPVYPGQFHNVKQNLFNVVTVVDLSQSSTLNFIAGAVNNIIRRGFPFRFGIVPIVETEDGLKMAHLFYYLIDKYGRAKTMQFMSQIAQLQTPIQLMSPYVDWSLAKLTFEDLQNAQADSEGHEALVTFDSVINGEIEGLSEKIGKAREYAKRLDASLESCITGHAFFNGKHFDMDDDFLKFLQVEHGTQLQYLQEKIYLAELGDDILPIVDTYFYDLPGANLRRNRYIFPGAQTGSLRIFNLPELFAKIGYQFSSAAYLYPESDSVPLSVYVVADLDSTEGIKLMREAVASLKSDSTSRLTFIHNPSTADSTQPHHRRISPIVSHLVAHDLLHKVPLKEFDLLLDPEQDQPLSAPTGQIILSENSMVYQLLQDIGLAMDGLSDSEAYMRYCHRSRLISRELGVAPGDQVLLVNGRLVGPIKPGTFEASDFEALGDYEIRKRVGPVTDALTNLTITPNKFDKASYANLVALASSVISSVQIPDPSEQGMFNSASRVRTRNYRMLSGNYTSFEVGNPETATFQFGVLLDPLSESAQKWSALLQWLATIPSVHAEVHLNPARHTELPLKRFYRYNLSPRLSFDENGEEIGAVTAFDNLPIDPLYTLAMDVPHAWLVRPRESLYDLDNIQLSALNDDERERGVEAIFDLDYIVIEGHAREIFTNQPPRGLQLQLTAGDGTPVDDTQVVLNLGYLQFKAKPGVYGLEIREGRGRDIYEMESVGNEGWASPSVAETGNEITLTSLEGLTLFPRVKRRPGMEKADVLAEFVVAEEESKGLFGDLASRVSSLFKPKEAGTKEVQKPRQADINIFTVASGHLYERFASIMMLSVLKHTDSTVKFWFIENFLSPSFLEFLPHFAEAYHFDYELVTYKWPSWLRAQKEKQRIIWAYKILFLDVLFPMDLKKVIFVDADQIVRTDLKELVDLDLHGAPYGYTPMGDDNTEMEGFRFWKTGYWKDFLKGRPYHISALYVVDLARFRQIAAGDILRGHYQTLSQDPNSLANLDQDLPNNLQREVPIFSLPEDWLWCETWCSKDRLNRAKTIDLCQNPLTKEPKLARARQIPEWEAYDGEIARFARRLADAGKISSHAVAAEVNVLAGGGTAKSDSKSNSESEPEPERKHTPESGERDGGSTDAQLEGDVGDVHRKDEL